MRTLFVDDYELISFLDDSGCFSIKRTKKGVYYWETKFFWRMYNRFKRMTGRKPFREWIERNDGESIDRCRKTLKPPISYPLIDKNSLQN